MNYKRITDILSTDEKIDVFYQNRPVWIQGVSDTIAKLVVDAVEYDDIKLIVTTTMTGFTARKISNLRPNCIVLACCPSNHIAEKVSLNFGVKPIVTEVYESTDEIIENAKNIENILGDYKPKSLSISLFFYLLKRMFLRFHMRKNQKKTFYFNVSNDSIKDWIAFFAALEVFFSRPSSFDSLNEWTSPSLPHPIHIVPEGMLSVPPPA